VDLRDRAAWLGGIGEAFSDRNFRIYSVGSLISWITYFIQEIAFSWAAWEATRSPAWLSAIALLTTGTMIALAPLGGALADRHDRFRLALIAYGCDAAKACVLAVLAYANALSLPVICVAAALHGLIHSFSIPASYGMMPRFVAPRRLASAIGVSAAYTQFAVFAGPAIAGWILTHGGVAAAFAANVAGYGIYFATAGLLRTPKGYVQPKPPRRSLRVDIAAGVTYVWRHEGLRSLLALGLASDAVAAALYKMMPAYADLVFRGGPGVVALFYGAAGIGATLAALAIARSGLAGATPQRVVWAGLGVAMAVALFATTPSLSVAVPAMLLFGVAAETRRTGAVAMMQAAVDDAQRGRVMSTLFLLTQIAGGLGTLALGGAAGALGLRAPLIVAVVGLGLVWLWVYGRRGRIAAAFAARAIG
jgi:MFS family permease